MSNEAETGFIIVGNNAPTIVGPITFNGTAGAASCATLSGFGAGPIVFGFELEDSTMDLSDVRLEYVSDDCPTPCPITEILGGVQSGCFNPPDPMLVTTSAPGSVHYDFTLDTVAQFGLQDAIVEIRVTPCDAFDEGQTACIRLEIRNDPLPDVAILDFGSDVDQHFEVAVDYVVNDEDGDRADLVFQWRPLGEPDFPPLDGTGPFPFDHDLGDPAVRAEVLADPFKRAALRIMTECPPFVEGNVRAGGATATSLRAFEAFAAARREDLVGLSVEILRETLAPALIFPAFNPTAIAGDPLTDTFLVAHPGGTGELLRFTPGQAPIVVATDLGTPAGIAVARDGRTALVTDVEMPGMERLLEIRLDVDPPVSPTVLASSGLPNAAGVAFVGTTGAVVAVDPGPGPATGELRFVPIHGGTPVTVFRGLAAPRGLAGLKTGGEVLIVESGAGGRILKTYVDDPGAVPGIVATGLGTPRDIALDPDGRSALVTRTQNGGSLLRVDLRRPASDPNFEELAPSLGTTLVGLGLSRDGKLALAGRGAAPGIRAVHFPGEVVQRRTIVSASNPPTITIDATTPFSPVPPPGTPFRIPLQASKQVATDGGRQHRFVWKSFPDVGTDGARSVFARASAFAQRAGGRGASGSPKLLRSGLLSPSPQGSIPPPTDCHGGLAVTTGDVDKDGYADVIASLACGSSAADRRTVYHRQDPVRGVLDPSPVVIAQGSGTVANNPGELAMGDVDGNGLTDVIVRGSVFRQTAPGTFTGTGDLTLALTGTVQQVAAGDVSGDGRTDVIASDSSDNVGVFIQKSNGLLGMPAVAGNPRLPDYFLDAAPFVNVLSIGDANGDGLADAVVGGLDFSGSFLAGSAEVFFQSGGELGVGPPGTSPRTPNETLDNEGVLATGFGDMNRDGHPDVVVAAAHFIVATFVDVFLFDPSTGRHGEDGPTPGDPRAPSLRLPAGFVQSMAVADTNGDGLRDVGVVDRLGDRVQTFLADGRGDFVFDRADVSVALSGDSADLDADGKGDFAVLGEEGDLTILVEEAAGGSSGLVPLELASSPRFPAVGDLTRDGRADIAVGDLAATFTLVEQVPGATLVARDPVLGFAAPALAIADVSGEGRSDLIAAFQTPVGSALLGVFLQGPGDLSDDPELVVAGGPGERTVTRIATGDLDGDGDQDVIAVSENTSNDIVLRVFLQDGGELALDDTQLLVFASSNFEDADVAVGDVDHDGDDDVVASAPNEDLVLVFHQAGGELGDDGGAGNPRVPSEMLESMNDPHGVAVGDVNGDGLPDVVAANENNKAVAIFLQEGGELGVGPGSPRTPSAVLETSELPEAIALGDVNGDGRGDVVVVCEDEAVVDVYLEDALGDLGVPGVAAGARAPSYTRALGPGEKFVSVSTGDVNGDGRTDIVAGGLIEAQLNIFYGQ